MTNVVVDDVELGEALPKCGEHPSFSKLGALSDTTM